MGAEGVHGLTREHLEKNGISQQEAAVELCSLVMKFMGDGEVPVLGHRVYFDKAFTDQLTNTIEIQLPWHPIMFDSCSLSSLMLEQTSSDALFDMMGLPPRSAHNAMEDILYTVASVKKIKEFFLAGVVAGT
jgi:oligoribonuclease (3'-5' exoribonuclease)